MHFFFPIKLIYCIRSVSLSLSLPFSLWPKGEDGGIREASPSGAPGNFFTLLASHLVLPVSVGKKGKIILAVTMHSGRSNEQRSGLSLLLLTRNSCMLID